jgi:hypothetical protein
MRNTWFVQGLVNNAVGVAMAVLVAYLFRNGSPWAAPVLYGLCALAATSFGAYALKATWRMPSRRAIPDEKNIEMLVRTWLDNWRVTVKSDPNPESYFRLIATMDSGTSMVIGRVLGVLSNYLILRHDIVPTAAEFELLNRLPPGQCGRIFSEIRLEIARSHVGCSAIGSRPEPFNIWKRIPINEHLTEHAFIAAMDDIEAASHALANIFLIGLQRNGIDPPAFVPVREPAPPAPRSS